MISALISESILLKIFFVGALVTAVAIFYESVDIGAGGIPSPRNSCPGALFSVHINSAQKL